MLPPKESHAHDADRSSSYDDVAFNRMREAFGRAAGAGFTHRQFLVAGYAIDLRIVGAQLDDHIHQAFAHLEPANTDCPALTIELWEEDAVGISGPRDWTRLAEPVLIMMKASNDGRFVCEQRPQALCVLDRSAHRIVGCTRSAGLRYLDERARPFHRLLSTWLNDRGIQFVHAGLVCVRGQGILFGGQGGAGKSTSSIACLLAGHKYLGDDFIGLEQLDNGSFSGYGFYASCLLEMDHVKRFGDLSPCALAPYYPHEDKALFYLNEMFPGAISHKTRIDGIALPRIANEDRSSIEPASKAETMLALAPTSVMLLPVPTAKAFHTLAQLVECVPSYRMHIGRDIDRIPDAVSQLAMELDARYRHRINES